MPMVTKKPIMSCSCAKLALGLFGVSSATSPATRSRSRFRTAAVEQTNPILDKRTQKLIGNAPGDWSRSTAIAIAAGGYYIRAEAAGICHSGLPWQETMATAKLASSSAHANFSSWVTDKRAVGQASAARAQFHLIGKTSWQEHASGQHFCGSTCPRQQKEIIRVAGPRL